MKTDLYSAFIGKKEKNQKSIAVLIDPDENRDPGKIENIIRQGVKAGIDYFFVGGSLLVDPDTAPLIRDIRKLSSCPVVLFPGSNLHLNFEADAILLLSLISGRNPEFLIGQHVTVAASIKKNGIETISTGYILIDGGKPTSVSYMSFTHPIPHDKPEIVSSTAMAGELLGLRMIYLEAGSGALYPVPEGIIRSVKKSVDVPVIVGGGINTTEKALRAMRAGADLIVVGNHIEKNPDFLIEITGIKEEYNQSLNIH
ncbi:MAG: geranylgeranylglyceryl/heptaprenylglyceryl phosphate synthase [Cyclobacteriaceae bacterium]|nr:geranylgeranylglyceryl/heptaprenylglyceryl phosphate synthase [Cyclobacteriaceae bacterium]